MPFDSAAALWERYLPDTAILYHRTVASDGYDNAGSVTWTAYGTVACRVAVAAPHSDTEGLAASQVLARGYMTAQLAYRTDVATTDRLSVNGVTYEVQGDTTGRSYPYGLSLPVVVVPA